MLFIIVGHTVFERAFTQLMIYPIVLHTDRSISARLLAALEDQFTAKLTSFLLRQATSSDNQ